MEKEKKGCINYFIGVLLGLVIAFGGILIYNKMQKNDDKKDDSVITQKSYYVTLMIDGKEYRKITVNENSLVNIPEAPVKEGKVFDYWEYNGQRFDVNTKITSDIVLNGVYQDKIKEPKEYNVTFKYNNGTNDVLVSVKEQEKVTEPTAPVKDGYKFIGWYNGNTKYDFNSLVKSDMILTAQYEQNKVATATMYGDANEDGVIDGRDVLRIAKFVLGVNNQVISAQGKINADVDLDGYITYWDSILVAKHDVGYQILLGEKHNQLFSGMILGDFYVNNDINQKDVDDFKAFLNNPNRQIAPWIQKGMDMNSDGKIDNKDLTILENLVKNKPTKASLYGDVNSDGVIDGRDVIRLEHFILNSNVNNSLITYQGYLNADADLDGDITRNDITVLMKYLAGQSITLGSKNNQVKRVMKGDFTLDGKIDKDDADGLESFLYNPSHSEPYFFKKSMDLNDDGKVDSSDVNILKGYVQSGKTTNNYINI